MIDPNAPAYPISRTDAGDIPPEFRGLTRREVFVKAAMQGLAANPSLVFNLNSIVTDAVTLADKTLAAMNREEV